MQNIRVITPQNVFIDLIIGSLGLRILSFILDVILLSIYIYGAIFFAFQVITDEAIGQVIVIILMLPAFFYSFWSEYVFNGQTIGKMVCGIKVIKLDGFAPGFIEYAIRWVFRVIDFWTFIFLISIFNWEFFGLAFFLSGWVAVISIITSSDGQRIGDRVAGTCVVKIKKRENISITIMENIQENYQPTYPEVVKLSDNDARIIKDTFIIAKKNRDYRTIKKLRLKLEEVMQIIANEEDIIFIEKVMKDFNYFTKDLS